MRALVQRVTRAAVVVNGRIVGQVDTGLLVLLGITHTDRPEEARWLDLAKHGYALSFLMREIRASRGRPSS